MPPVGTAETVIPFKHGQLNDSGNNFVINEVSCAVVRLNIVLLAAAAARVAQSFTINEPLEPGFWTMIVYSVPPPAGLRTTGAVTLRSAFFGTGGKSCKS